MTDFSPILVCGVEGCNVQHHAKGLCKVHYLRMRNHGTTEAKRAAHGAPMRWLNEHVDCQSDHCLTWPFSRLSNGRPQIKGGSAARVMCALAHGAAPSPKHEAAHSCGKGHEGCINPKHMYWATSAENDADKIKHGTLVAGERHPGAKLTSAQVRAVRDLDGTMTQREIARRFGISQSRVHSILHGKARKHG